MRAHVSIPSPGLFRIDPALLGDPDAEAVRYALRILLSIAGGREHLPADEAALRLVERLRSHRDASGPVRVSLARAVVDMRAGGIFLHRERRALPPPLAAQDCLWDGRYRIETDRRLEGLFVAPLGHGHEGEAAETAFAAPPALARTALAAEPALWRAGRPEGLLNKGAGGAIRLSHALGPWARFLPSFDLAAAEAAARLTGTTLPASPLKNAANASPPPRT